MKVFFDLFNPSDVKGGLWRLALLSVLSMTILRALFNPSSIVFRTDEMGNLDYVSMIAMSALLIAIDAMLLVILSWNNLRDWKDALGVAALVGTTHVFFPLFTFGITAAVALCAKALGLPTVLAGGAQTAIYFIAFVFVASHLREINTTAREGDVKAFQPKAPVSSWTGVRQVWPAVVAVSIDALMVGPAKVAFMARYSPLRFGLSFMFIGATVFVLVFGSGVIVLALKAFVKHHLAISAKVHRFDWLGSLGLIAVFIHFSVFAFVYVMYTFAPKEWLLQTQAIWGTTVVLFTLYLVFGRIGEIKAASRQRAGLT